MIDLHFIAAVTALFAIGVGGLSYWLGRRHGWDCGYLAGCAKADRLTRPMTGVRKPTK